MIGPCGAAHSEPTSKVGKAMCSGTSPFLLEPRAGYKGKISRHAAVVGSACAARDDSHSSNAERRDERHDLRSFRAQGYSAGGRHFPAARFSLWVKPALRFLDAGCTPEKGLPHHHHHPPRRNPFSVAAARRRATRRYARFRPRRSRWAAIVAVFYAPQLSAQEIGICPVFGGRTATRGAPAKK